MTDPAIIEWKDPPDNSHFFRGGRWKVVADALRARPGEWALIKQTGSSTFASDIKAGRTRGFAPAGSFDAVGRRNDKQPTRSDIYARYVGNGDADEG